MAIETSEMKEHCGLHEVGRCLKGVPAHVIADSLVVQDTLDAANSTHGNILIPQPAVGKLHDVLLGDLADGALNVFGSETAASGDDLATNVLSNSGGAVEREEDRGLELSLGPLNLSAADVEAQAAPFAQSKVDQVIKTGEVLGNKVDTPETTIPNQSAIDHFDVKSPQHV